MALQQEPEDLDALIAERTQELSLVVARLQRELSDKKIAEAHLRAQAQKLAEATERYELVARMTSDAVYDWDLETNRLTFGVGISKLFGHPQDVPPTFEWWAEQLHPDERERILLSLESSMAPGKDPWSAEYRFRRGDGTYATVFDRGIFVRDEAAKAVRMIGAMMDVTERRSMEQRLVFADRMASVGALAAGVAHEINNPLTYMMSSQQRALQTVESLALRPIEPHAAEAARELLADAARSLREAEGGAERVRRIVRDLKTFARAEEDAHTQALDVRSVLDTALALAWNEIRHRATLQKRYADVPKVRANEGRLGQVFLGLLVNAAQAIPTGSAARNTISLDVRTEQGRIAIEIKDTGGGISPEAQRKLFEPFSGLASPGEGTGLGLAICRSIVEGLQGEITVESEIGKGSTFRVLLPPAPEEAWAERPSTPPPVSVLVTEPQPSSEPEVPRGRVLVVDDEPLVRTAAARTLSKQHDVVEVESGTAALDRLRGGQRYDAIICDLMMPELTGMELFTELERSIPEQAARIVFLSGGAFTPGAQEFLNRTSRPSLEKPFRAWELRGAVGSIIAELGLLPRG